MKKISVLLLSLLVIGSCIPQKSSAGALACLAIGGACSLVGLGIVHPKTTVHWKKYSKKVEGSILPDPVKSFLNKYYAWQLPITDKQRLSVENGLGRVAKFFTADKKSKSSPYSGKTLAIIESVCVLVGVRFILKAVCL
jgi:hypothetical protein